MMRFEDLTEEEKRAILEWFGETLQPVVDAIESLGDWLLKILSELEVLNSGY